MQRKRDVFIDSIKIYACVLVVLGHFAQSMVSSGFVVNSTALVWFDTTIYYFHVPLFFICSGYLFSKYTQINSFADYRTNIAKKLLALGVPYLFFSLVTWALKMASSSHVNSQADDVFTTLFVDPVSPYWYLYTLFLIFVITPALKSKRCMYILLVAGLCLKLISFFILEESVFALVSVTQNEIWFILGMCMNTFAIDRIFKNKGSVLCACVLSAMFVALSVVIVINDVNYQWVSFLMGVAACTATVILSLHLSSIGFVNKLVLALSRYTMPVYLMHTIFAAGLRIMLLKLSVTSVAVHVVMGLLISFIGPIVAYAVMSRFKVTDFVFNPTKYIKLRKQEKTNG